MNGNLRYRFNSFSDSSFRALALSFSLSLRNISFVTFYCEYARGNLNLNLDSLGSKEIGNSLPFVTIVPLDFKKLVRTQTGGETRLIQQSVVSQLATPMQFKHEFKTRINTVWPSFTHNAIEGGRKENLVSNLWTRGRREGRKKFSFFLCQSRGEKKEEAFSRCSIRP